MTALRARLHLALFAGALASPSRAADRIISPPTKVWPAAVALVVDEVSAKGAEKEIAQWRAAAEADGWSTYLVVDDWKRCEDVRDAVVQLAHATPPIEGALLAGRVPTAIVHGAAHLRANGSTLEDDFVASDVYYADFHLRFDFTSTDAKDPSSAFNRRGADSPVFASCELAIDSPQRIVKDIFVARVRPSPDSGLTEGLRAFFVKAAECHAARKPLSRLLRVANDEPTAEFESDILRAVEQFPSLYLPGRSCATWQRTSDRQWNSRFVAELQRADLDMAFMRAPMLLDSHRILTTVSQELVRGGTRPRVLMFAEAGGSGTLDDVPWSQQYVCGQGTTVACVTNRDAGEVGIGTLALGASIGQWHRRVNVLDSQLVGDPTFAFATGALSPVRSDPFAVANVSDEALDAMLSVQAPAAVREVALGIAAGRRGDTFTPELARLVKGDPSRLVRRRALELLARTRSNAFESVLVTALADPCELVRFSAASVMGDVGRAEYVRPLLIAHLSDSSPRVVSKAIEALLVYDPEQLGTEIDRMVQVESPRSIGLEFQHTGIVERAHADFDGPIATLTDPRADPQQRVAAITKFRGTRPYRAIFPLLGIAANAEFPATVRRSAIEVLAWYQYSGARPRIIDGLRTIAADEHAPREVRDDATRGANRLAEGPNTPLMP